MSKLDEICDKKREHIEAQKQQVSLDELQERCADAAPVRGFIGALMCAEGPALIAEVKKASPSKGVIREDFNPVEIAKAYEAAGATCLSVLTDAPYFQGDDAYIAKIKEQVQLPVLRKDFMLDPYQIYESRVLGADCVLLIMAALEDREARKLFSLAEELHMDVLVEVHDEEELERAEKLSPMLLGINNRNLKTLEVDVQTSMTLVAKAPPYSYKVSESGIADFQTIQTLKTYGFQGFLVGESLMVQPDIEQATKTLLGKAA